MRQNYESLLSPELHEAPAMRMPRLRFTIRRMMAVVAIVAIALSLLAVRRRSTFEEGRVFHAEQERRALYLQRLTEAQIKEELKDYVEPKPPPDAFLNQEVARFKRLAALHGRL